MSKSKALNARLSESDYAAFQEVALDCGYENLSAFVRAIARKDIPVGHGSQLNTRIDKLSNRIGQLEQQRDRDWEAMMQHIQALSNKAS